MRPLAGRREFSGPPSACAKRVLTRSPGLPGLPGWPCRQSRGRAAAERQKERLRAMGKTPEAPWLAQGNPGPSGLLATGQELSSEENIFFFGGGRLPFPRSRCWCAGHRIRGHTKKLPVTGRGGVCLGLQLWPGLRGSPEIAWSLGARGPSGLCGGFFPSSSSSQRRVADELHLVLGLLDQHLEEDEWSLSSARFLMLFSFYQRRGCRRRSVMLAASRRCMGRKGSRGNRA